MATRLICVVVLLVASGMSVAWAQKIYTCVDQSGRRHTADRPIAECTDRQQRVLGRSGMERERIGPMLSDNDRMAIEEQRNKEMQERVRAAEQRRYERSLLARYPNEARHQQERTKALVEVNQTIEDAKQRIIQLQERRKSLDEAMQAYSGDPNRAPLDLQRQVTDNNLAQGDQNSLITAQELEKKRINQGFDAELDVLRKIWSKKNKQATTLEADGSAQAQTQQQP